MILKKIPIDKTEPFVSIKNCWNQALECELAMVNLLNYRVNQFIHQNISWLDVAEFVYSWQNGDIWYLSAFLDILLFFFFALVSLNFVYCENDTVDKAFLCYYCIVMTLDVAEVISMNLSSWCGHYLISIRKLTIIGILTRVISNYP